MSRISSPLAPALMSAMAAIVWGLWWIPVRYLSEAGLTGTQAGMTLNGGGAVAALALVLLLRQRLTVSWALCLGAIMTGMALSFYSISLTLSDVVRVILLFYLAPAWSKIIELAFMEQGWGWSSTLTVTASLAGGLLILGGDFGTRGINAGDVLAILSGVAWAIGAALIFVHDNKGQRASTMTLTFIMLAAATLIAIGFATLMGEAIIPHTDTSPIATGPIATGLGIGAIYALGCTFATVWAAQRLAPALLTFLFTLELCSGVISGALFLDEPFGWTQAAGTLLIIGAALTEFALSMRSSNKPTTPLDARET